MDYRILAELLRQVEFLLPLGFTLRGVKSHAYEKNSGASWVNWYLRGVIRKIGLCKCKIDNDALELNVQLFREKLLQEQKNFYASSAVRKKAVAARLQKYGIIFFNIGIAVTILRVAAIFVYQMDKQFPVWYMGIKIPTFINMLCLLLPAVGSAIFAVASQIGYDKLGSRYDLMENQINEVISSIDQIGRISYQKLGRILHNASEMLIEEVSDWRVYFKSKGISKR